MCEGLAVGCLVGLIVGSAVGPFVGGVGAGVGGTGAAEREGELVGDGTGALVWPSTVTKTR